MTTGTKEQGRGGHISLARGGPLYVPNLVGPLTSVPEFEASIVEELQCLQTELLGAEEFEDELSVDELLVFTEEELLEKALEALEGTEEEVNLTPTTGECSVPMESTAASTMLGKEIVPMIVSSNREFISETMTSSNSSSIEPHGRDHSEDGEHIKTKSKKRGRLFDRDTRASEFNNINFDKVEQFVKIKQNQQKDRAAASLHSFNGSSKPAAGALSTSEYFGRMKSLRFITSPSSVIKLNVCQHTPVRRPAVILCVEVYDNSLTWQKNQELLVLGTQRLSALRDNIYCSTDQLMQAAGQYDPSGYFLIEDLLLNDMRDPLSIDYSKPIREWLGNCQKDAKEKWEFIVSGELKKHRRLLGNLTSSNVPQLKASDMHKTHFCDLRFCLGSGYLYCHQGNCKHVVVIRDMRLLHPEDDQNEDAYPIVTFQVRRRRQKCSVCKIKWSVMMTADDKWAAKNPCYFCKDCYYLLHYKEDNSLLYEDFRVYDVESRWPVPAASVDKAQHRTPDADPLSL